MFNVGTLVARIRLDTRQWDLAVNRIVGTQLSGLRRAVSISAQGISDLSNQFALAGITIGGSIAALGTHFISASNKIEQFRLRMAFLLRSQERANQLMQHAITFAIEAPFEFEHIAESVTTLAGIMRGGIPEIQRWLPLISDLATVTGLGIQETTAQIVRMYSAGAQAADRFRERGISQMLGFKAGVAYTAEETRKILLEAFEGPNSKFRGASVALTSTFEGLVSKLKDQWFIFRNSVLQDTGLFQLMKDKVAAIGVIWEQNESAISSWLVKNKEAIISFAGWATVITAVTGGFVAFGLALRIVALSLAVFAPLLTAINIGMSLLGINSVLGLGPFIVAITSIAGAVYMLRALWNKNWAQIQETFESFKNTMKQKFQEFKELLIAAFTGDEVLQALSLENLYNTIRFVLDRVIALVKGVGSIMGHLIGGGDWKEVSKVFLDTMEKTYLPTFEEMVAGTQRMGVQIKQDLEKQKDIFTDVSGVVKEQFKEDWDAISAYLKEKFGFVLDAYETFKNYKVSIPKLPEFPPLEPPNLALEEYKEQLNKIIGTTEEELREKLKIINSLLASEFLKPGSFDSKKLEEALADVKKELFGIIPLEERLKNLGIETSTAIKAKIRDLEGLAIIYKEDKYVMSQINEELKKMKELLDGTKALEEQLKDLNITSSAQMQKRLNDLQNLIPLLGEDQYALEQIKNSIRELNEEVASLTQQEDFFGGLKSGLQDLALEWTNFRQVAKDSVVEVGKTMEQSFSRGFAAVLTKQQTAKEAFIDFSKTVINRILEIIGTMIFQATVGRALSALVATEVSVTASTVAAAWAPAAALASLATLGTNSAAALTGIASTIAATQAMATGGGVLGSFEKGTSYVPRTGLYQLHEGEGVLTKEENREGFYGKAEKEKDINITINNILEKKDILDVVATPEGHHVVVNHITTSYRNNGPVKKIIKAG